MGSCPHPGPSMCDSPRPGVLADVPNCWYSQVLINGADAFGNAGVGTPRMNSTGTRFGQAIHNHATSDHSDGAHVGEQAGQSSVDAYELGWVEHSAPMVDVELTRYAQLARELTGSTHAAIDILDPDSQVTLASAPAALPVAVDRSLSMCARILYDTSAAGVVVAADASKEGGLCNHPMVSGASGSVRFYAAATLTGREGLPLGMLSVYSEQVVSAEAAERAGAVVQSVGQAIVSTLEARRVARDQHRSASGTPAMSTISLAEESRSERVRRGNAINAIIDGGAIRTIFQPIVHLGTGEVVGFEALSRGPETTELESPMALLAAAREVGRLGELDWLCRARALHAASCSGFPSNLSWFINVEPAGLEIECPTHLRPILDRARCGLRVVLEVVEREVEGHVTKLLRATEQARKDAWGVALDDVGAEVGSLALLPFFQPDVVKLDMSLLRAAPSYEAAEITAAVRAYAEGRQAVILAEGIETKEHERLAKVFGATYGQGYLYGHPGPLPASVPAPDEAIPLRQRPHVLAGATPFEVLNAGIESQRGVLGDLSHILNHLGRHCAQADDAGVLLTMFASESHYQRRRQMLDVFAEHNAFTVVLIRDGRSELASPRFHVASLAASSRMNNEILIDRRDATLCGRSGPAGPH